MPWNEEIVCGISRAFDRDERVQISGACRFSFKNYFWARLRIIVSLCVHVDLIFGMCYSFMKIIF